MNPMEILLVEDNAADILLTEEAFSEAAFAHQLHVAQDGIEALAFLRREPPYLPRPDPRCDPARPQHAPHERAGAARCAQGRR